VVVVTFKRKAFIDLEEKIKSMQPLFFPGNIPFGKQFLSNPQGPEHQEYNWCKPALCYIR